MKKISSLFLLLCAGSACAQNAAAFLVECENFGDKGGWTSTDFEGQKILLAAEADKAGVAKTQVSAPKTGTYHAWSSFFDFSMARMESPRNFTVSVNSKPLANSGYFPYGANRWSWAYLGEVKLKAGKNLVSMASQAKNVRVDCIYFTQDASFNPNLSMDRNADKSYKETFLVETKNFQFPDGWTIKWGVLLDSIYCPAGRPSTQVPFLKRGKYTVWSLGRDYPNNLPNTRRYSVSVNDEPLSGEGGKHGKEGSHWEKLGEVEITREMNLISLAVLSSTPKAEAVLFTQDESFDPEAKKILGDAKRSYSRSPVPLPAEKRDAMAARADSSRLRSAPDAEKISIENSVLRVSYEKWLDENSKPVFVRSAEVRKDGVWKSAGSFKDEILFRLFAPKCEYALRVHALQWLNTHSRVKTVFGGHEYEFRSNTEDPYAAGDARPLTPVDVAKEGGKLKITYDDGTTALLGFADEVSPIVRMGVKGEADLEGFHSYGFAAFNPVGRDRLSNAQLPPCYMNRQVMTEPTLVPINVVSQAMTLLEIKTDGGAPFSCALFADPEKIPFEWPTSRNSVYGFTMLSPNPALFQNAIFQPILGGMGSRKNIGDSLEASWLIYCDFADWPTAMKTADENVFPVSKLREPFDTSLSDAISNIGAYMKSEDSGWCDILKGRYDIEIKMTVVHASPLAELEAALLMDDEEYYMARALPAIEYTLSRESCHFSLSDLGQDPRIKTRLSVPSNFWGADYYAALNLLTQNQNLWLEDFYRTADGKIKRCHSPEIPEWAVLTGLYLAEGDKKYLDEALEKARVWAQVNANLPIERSRGPFGFTNTNFYPYWWYMPELIELSKDKSLEDFARKCAYNTMGALWNHPVAWDEEITINKGGYAIGIPEFWWKGDVHFRLGYDESRSAVAKVMKVDERGVLRRGDQMKKYTAEGMSAPGPRFSEYFPAPEKRAKASQVTRLGMGIEGPPTYTCPTNSMQIVMPSWAAALHKMYQLTGDDLMMKYARHSIVGRFANFLGYYVRDYTDIYQGAEFPYKGPDLSNLYFHHAPCHFAQTFDYLMAQIDERSSNLIKFPHVRQQGYVWFANRIYGARGKVFDDEGCRPMLAGSAVRADTHKASVLLARSKNSVWAIFLNDTGSEITLTPEFDFTSKALRGAKADAEFALFNASGKETGKISAQDAEISIPALGLVALKIPAEDEELYAKAQKPLGASAHKTHAGVSKDLKDLHFFRIRSPFGKDSVFAVFTGKGAKGQSAEMKVKFGNAEKTLASNSYPYEFSLYGIPFDDDISCEVKFKGDDGKDAAISETLTAK